MMKAQPITRSTGGRFGKKGSSSTPRAVDSKGRFIITPVENNINTPTTKNNNVSNKNAQSLSTNDKTSTANTTPTNNNTNKRGCPAEVPKDGGNTSSIDSGVSDTATSISVPRTTTSNLNVAGLAPRRIDGRPPPTINNTAPSNSLQQDLPPPQSEPIPKKQRLEEYTIPCIGLNSGSSGTVLSFVAHSMLNTAHKLLDWARDTDGGLNKFASSALATSTHLLLPLRGMVVSRAKDALKGFVISSVKCTLKTLMGGNNSKSERCDCCLANKKKCQEIIRSKHSPTTQLPNRKSRIDYIAQNPQKAELEIRHLRAELKRLNAQLARDVMNQHLEERGAKIRNKKLERTVEGVNIMSPTIEKALEDGGDVEALELWKIHREHLNKQYENGGKKRGRAARVDPVLLDWAVAFLAKTSVSVYKEVAKVMLLPDIRLVQRRTAKLVSSSVDKALSMMINNLKRMKERADKEDWTENQRKGCVGFDSANINSGIQHDYVSNTLVGGDESHSLTSLSKMFHSMAEKVKKAGAELSSAEEDLVGSGEADQEVQSASKNKVSILDNLRLANEYLVFKWTSIDPDIDCSEIVASISIEKCTPQIQAYILRSLRDTLPIFGFAVSHGASDAAGCNWLSFKNLADLPISKLLPADLMSKYESIDFDIEIVHEDPVSGEYIIFLPDMPHLIKNVVTALELSSNSKSKRDIKFGKCPVNLGMSQEVWEALGGLLCQLQETKLTIHHFLKNAFSRMSVSLAMQVLSASTAAMIRKAIEDEDVNLSLSNKGMYHHLANLCEHMNDLADICNGRDGPHSPENALERQTKLLDILAWFTAWKDEHDRRVADEEATEFNFFAPETWFCLRALILGQVATIQLYCVELGVCVKPRSLNTDVVEWFFGHCRQMVGGSTNKMTTRAWNHGVGKSAAFRAGKHTVVGNNKTGADEHFVRQKRY